MSRQTLDTGSDAGSATPPERAGTWQRRLAIVLAVVAPLGPLFMAIHVAALPYSYADDAPEWIAKIADPDNAGRVDLSHLAILAWALVGCAGAIVVGLVARAGSRRLGTVGMVTTFAGFAALSAGGHAYDGSALAAMRAGLDVTTAEGVMAEIDRLQAPTVGAAVFIPMMFLGTALLGVALWRGRLVPRWAGVALLVSMPVVLAGGYVWMPLNAAGWALMAVVYGVVGAAFARGVTAGRVAASTRERTLLAVVAPLAPMAMGVWALAMPTAIADTFLEGLPKIAAAPGRIELALWMLFAFALLAPVTALVVGLVARRGSPRLGSFALGSTFLGFAALSAGGYASLGLALAAIRAGVPNETAARMLDEAAQNPASLAAGFFLLPMLVGIASLGVALWRGRIVPRWVAGAVLVAFPVVIAGGYASMQVNAVGWFLLAIATAATGRVYATVSARP